MRLGLPGGSPLKTAGNRLIEGSTGTRLVRSNYARGMDKHDEIWLRGESANISNTLNCAGLVLASWYPDHPTDPGWPGSIVAVSGEPNFPLDAWEARDKDALRAWLERAHPEWVTVVEDA